jgi:Ribonuclease G/E
MLTLHASWSPGELRVAAWEGGLVDYAISRDGRPDGVGELHRGRVIARVPAMAGSFVALDRSEGFLPDSEGGSASEGSVLGVRITRAAQGGKGPRLSARLSQAEQAVIGTGPPARLRPGPDALDRLIALFPASPVLVDDAALARRGTLVGRAFDGDIETAVAALQDPVAALPGGARMSVHPTPALVAIDIDLGSASSRRDAKASAQRGANQALLPELCRQIRLRNLSGAILVDLAGMAVRKRASLAPGFIAALADDPLSPHFLGFTALGLAEILRPRVHPPLHELLAGPHTAGLAALRAVFRETVANPSRLVALRALPSIANAIRTDGAALSALAQRSGRDLIIIDDRSLVSPGWNVEDAKRG